MQVQCGGKKRDLDEAIEYCTDERVDAGDMCHQTLIDFRDACKSLTARLADAEAAARWCYSKLEGCEQIESARKWPFLLAAKGGRDEHTR